MVKKTINSHYIVILCGGTGPRLWPLSRVDRPKQFLKLFSDNSLIKETFLRAKRIVPAKNIYLVTNVKYETQIKSNLKGLALPQNILAEPQKKNTAMALLYASATISQKDPSATITSFPSDHFISQLVNFDKDIKKSFILAQNKAIVTLGIKPNSPSPSFGYISINSQNQVTGFIEKPSLLEAQKLIKKNNCFWNSGFYSFKIETLLEEFKLYAKEYLPLYNKLIDNLDHPRVVQKIYSLAPSLPIDTAISEKSKKLILIPASFNWNDIGEWKSIYEELPKSGNNFALLPKNQKFVEVNSKNCLLVSSPSKIIGLVDVNNLAIIDTPDALLICNMATDGSFHVRNLVTKIVSNLKLKHFFTGKHD
jgi:mannose-1-phosphate guanylyltransferase/mannose-6-phosphate isomerase